MCNDIGQREDRFMFSRSSQPAPPTGVQASFIAADLVIAGDIEASGALHIDGKVTGDVRCAALSQGESGVIHGNIVADEIRLAGLVDGGVETGALALESSARITGDILYESLTVACGAEVEGRFRRRRPGDHGSMAARAEQPAPVEPNGQFAGAPAVLAAE
jgi:cytoskeletal protein CcmA (bactofilin family)